MPTLSVAIATIRALMEENPATNPTNNEFVPFRWRGDHMPPLPDTPSPFIYSMFTATRSETIEVGGGRGANRHRNPLEVEVFVFIPNELGLQYGTDIAEHFAALFRPYSASGLACENATAYPGGPGSEISVPGMDNESGNYFWSGCGANFHFDLIG
jgi:hypothetical protein